MQITLEIFDRRHIQGLDTMRMRIWVHTGRGN